MVLYPTVDTGMARIRLVFGDGSVRFANLPQGVSDDEEALEGRAGPVLAAVVTSCTPSTDGSHTVEVPEIPTARLGAPLARYLAGHLEGNDLNVYDDDDLRAFNASYCAAAERLDVPGFVTAVERMLLDAVASGTICPVDVADAFASCPRVNALMTHYGQYAGASRLPPFNLRKRMRQLAQKHGIVLVIGQVHHNCHRIWFIVGVTTCRERADSHKCAVYRRAVQRVPLDFRVSDIDDDDEDDKCYADDNFVMYSMDEDCDLGITAYGDLTPCLTSTWLQTNDNPITSDHTYEEITELFSHVHSIDIILTPPKEDGDATTVYSMDTLSDFLIEKGVEARFGPRRWGGNW